MLATEIASQELKSAQSIPSTPKTTKIRSAPSEGFQRIDKSTLPTQYLSLCTTGSAQPQIVRAICRPTVTHNLIARRIVRRLNLSPDKSSIIPDPLLWGQSRIEPIGDYVDLTCYAKGSKIGTTYRFHLVKDCGLFDMLFGSDVVG